MPKDSRPKTSLALPDRPRRHRELPEQFHQQLQAEHAAGKPHVYTSAKVRAIARFVSTPNSGVSLTRLFTTETSKRHHEAIAADRDYNQQRRDLASRLSNPKPPLCERITARPAPVPAALKPILVDFKKHSTEDLIGIFRPRLDATLLRLSAIAELDQFQDQIYDHRCAYKRTVEKLTLLRDQFELRAGLVTPEEWRTLEWGLKKIGAISFKGLRKNLDSIIVELYRVDRDSHFDWIG